MRHGAKRSLERDTHPKGEKQHGLTESEHHCTIVLLYETIFTELTRQKELTNDTSKESHLFTFNRFNHSGLNSPPLAAKFRHE